MKSEKAINCGISLNNFINEPQALEKISHHPKTQDLLGANRFLLCACVINLICEIYFNPEAQINHRKCLGKFVFPCNNKIREYKTMMEQLITYVILFGIIVIIGQLFNKSTLPITLLLVITGMLLSGVPGFPQITLNPNLVLDIFLPLLVYKISAFASWKDVQKNIRPIALLSIGHVIFITFLVAIIIHSLLPQLGWPLAFVLGAVISPPDDVAIVAIAEKIRIPERVLTILQGEGLFNDATALILFRVALTATIIHQFSMTHAVITFFLVIIGETLYGLAIGFVLGELRLKIHNTWLHVIASTITPFIAYLPPVLLGGSGVLATVITGFMIGNRYGERFNPEFRLVSRALWPALAFAIQGLLFLLVGLNLKSIVTHISSISMHSLVLYTTAVILTVIIGRFIWVYGFLIYFPRLLVPSLKKRDPYPPWQFPFLISWAGMRGAISLAAALAVPILPSTVEGANPRDFLIFLVFCVIAATFVLQGLTLPWIIKTLGITQYGQREQYSEHLAELDARLQMTKAVLHWLKEYKNEVKDDPKLSEQVKLFTEEYQMLKNRLKETIAQHDGISVHDEKAELQDEAALLTRIIEIEKKELLKLWHEGKINLNVRNKLLSRLDHRFEHISA